MEKFINYLKSDTNASNQFIKGIMKQNWSNESYWEEIIPMLDFSDSRVEKYVKDNINDFRIDYLIKYSHCATTKIIDIIISHIELLEDNDLENLVQFQKLTHKQLEEIIEFSVKSKEQYLSLINLAQEFQQLTPEFIEKYKSDLNWDLISENQFMDLKFLLKYKKNLNWELVALNQHLQPIFNESFLKLFEDTNIWDGIGFMEQITSEIIEKYKNKLTEKSYKSISLREIN